MNITNETINQSLPQLASNALFDQLAQTKVQLGPAAVIVGIWLLIYALWAWKDVSSSLIKLVIVLIGAGISIYALTALKII